jgi:hypothetical protein
MTTKELEDLVKQVYFHCTNKSPDGLYPAEVDLLEFTSKLLAVVAAQSD